jgi:plastocyanin
VPASSRVAAKASSVSIVGAQFSAFAFNPKTITVHVGDTVRWVNNSSAPEGHTVTGHGLDSGTLHQGDDYSFKFSKAGTYDYVCAFHSNMKGAVKVLASGGSSGGSPNGGSSSDGGSPSSGSGTGSSGTSSSGFGSSAADPGSSGQLPITGLPLLPLAVAGVGLILLGALLSRLEFY